MNAVQLAEFRSVETVDPTKVTIYPDRVVLTSGAGEGSDARIVHVQELDRVKVRTIFGISTLLMKTRKGQTVVADLLPPADARSAKALIDDLLSGSTPVSEELPSAGAAA